MRKSTVALLSVLLLALVPTCLATPLTFAQFDLEGVPAAQQNIFTMLYSAGPNTNTLTGSATNVTFAFLPGSGATLGTGDVQAIFTFSGVTHTAGATLFGNIGQGNYSGTFAFTLATPIGGKTNLLSATFGPTTTLSLGGGGASFNDSTTLAAPLEIVFSSDFMTFGGGSEAFAFSLSNVHPPSTLNGASFVSPFSAAGTGTFSANIVPEPMSFLLVGVGLVGLGLLRRKLTK